VSSLHPIVEAASRGELPPWAEVDRKRLAHMRRVAELLDDWSVAAGLDADERRRRIALGYLHDALKGAAPDALRELLDPPLRDLPGPVLHGPAAAELLAREGVDDLSLLRAVRYHTLGHPDLDDAGRALYAADFLEPGRDLRNRWRAGLRARMPSEGPAVVRDILQARIKHLLNRNRPVRPETIAFWNSLTKGPSWVRASEV
jgi:2-amino-4-hydroxy-6-hydroxymethyldihydropteridine diphosphokinase